MRNKKVLISLIILVSFITIGSFSFAFLYKPKNVFLKNANSFYKQMGDMLKESFGESEYMRLAETKTMQTKGSMSWNVSSSLLAENQEYKTMIDEVNKSSVDYLIAIDKKNKKLQSDINIKYNGQNFLNVKAYLQEKYGYLYLTDIFDKYIKFPVDNSDELFNSDNNIEDTIFVADYVVTNYVENIPSDAFIQGTEDLTINGEVIKARKIEYAFTANDASENMIKVLTAMKIEDEIIDKLIKITGDTKAELLKSIDEMIADLESETDDTKKVRVIMHVKGLTNDFIRLSLIDDNNETLFVVTNVNDEDTQIDIYDSSKITSTIIISKVADKNYKYTVDMKDAGMKISGTIKTTHTVVTENIQYQDSISFTMVVTTMGQEALSLSLENNATTKFGVALSIVDFANSVDMNALTAEDKEAISNKIMTKLQEISIPSI